jgi:outer membrane protein assembly factor BamE (lipoprotein component of BamABCDE complex)
MHTMTRLAVICFIALCSGIARADSIPMTDFIQLKTGMTEAEVLYRVGVYDHETVATDYFHNVIQKTWYYIPAHSERSNSHWITEIVFDGTGRMISIDRYKP